MELVPVLLDDGVPAVDEICEPDKDLLGDGVNVLLAVMTDESKGVWLESCAERHGSAMPPDENAVGTVDWPK